MSEIQEISKPKAGVFISIEGADGSGKSTCAKELVEYLNSMDIKAIYTREPGGTVFGEKMREMIVNHDESLETVDPTVRLLQFISLRVQHLKKVVIPNVRNGVVVVCDRYMDSTDIYNGKIDMQGLLLKQLYGTHTLKFLSVRPDFTFVYDVRKEVGVERVGSRGGNKLDEKYADISYSLWSEKIDELLSAYSGNKIKVINGNSTLDHTIQKTHEATQSAFSYFNSINTTKVVNSYKYWTQDVYVGS